jgi:hypothetical protein
MASSVFSSITFASALTVSAQSGQVLVRIAITIGQLRDTKGVT